MNFSVKCTNVLIRLISDNDFHYGLAIIQNGRFLLKMHFHISNDSRRNYVIYLVVGMKIT